MSFPRRKPLSERPVLSGSAPERVARLQTGATSIFTLIDQDIAESILRNLPTSYPEDVPAHT